MSKIDMENEKPGRDWLSLLLVLTYPIWAIVGGWIGWLYNGWTGAILGIIVLSFLYLMGIGASKGGPDNAESFVFFFFMYIGGPIGAAIGLLWFGSGGGVFIGFVVGFIFGSILGAMITKVLGGIYPQWTPESQWRVEDKPKLEAYFKQMGELNLSEDAPDALRKHAREITLAVLPTLQSEAKWKVLKYLSETCRRYPDLPAGLITRGHPIVDLHGAELAGQCDWSDLYHFDLSGTDLRRARFGSAPMADMDLSGADLRQANLGTSLAGIDFTGANLREADLYYAHLSGANFTHADLRGADLRSTYGLETTVFTQANYDSSTKWPEDFDLKDSGAVLVEK